MWVHSYVRLFEISINNFLVKMFIIRGVYRSSCMSFILQCLLLLLWFSLSITLFFFFPACLLLLNGVRLSPYCISTPQENHIKIFCLLQIKFCLFFSQLKRISHS